MSSRPFRRSTTATELGASGTSASRSATTAAVLAAASALLSEQGASALSVRRIAKAAGCSTMAIYSHFGSKHGVVDALYREGFARLAHAQGQVRRGASGLAYLRALTRTYRRVALGNATHYALMFGNAVPDFAPSEDSRRLAWSTFERLVAAVSRCIEEGALRSGDPEAIAHLIFGICHGMVSLELSGMVPGADHAAARYHRAVEAVLRGTGV